MADFKGQKIRAPGGAPIQMEPFKKLGASPLSIPLGEALPALADRVGGIRMLTALYLGVGALMLRQLAVLLSNEIVTAPSLNQPISESGMVTAGMSVARTSRRNTKTRDSPGFE